MNDFSFIQETNDGAITGVFSAREGTVLHVGIDTIRAIRYVVDNDSGNRQRSGVKQAQLDALKAENINLLAKQSELESKISKLQQKINDLASDLSEKE